MLALDQFRIKADSSQHGIVFSFNGFITEGLLFALGDALKKRMYRDEEDISTIRRVFSLFVEQAQNIIHYSAETAHDEGTGTERTSSGRITVGRERGKFFVVCGSIMHREEVIPLQARLEKIRSLDPAGMKAYYFEKIRNPELDDNHTFYCLKVFI